MQTTFDSKSTPTCTYLCLAKNGSCPEEKGCQIRRKIITKIKARHRTASEKAINIHHIAPPKLEDIQEIIYAKLSGDGKCPYCKRDLDIFATTNPESLSLAYSLDHHISCHSGGTNEKKNLLIICHRCNIVKGVVHPDYFNTIVNCLIEEYGLPGLNKFLDALYKPLFAASVKSRVETGDAILFG